MKLQIDTVNKTIEIINSELNLGDFIKELKKLLPDGEWKNYKIIDNNNSFVFPYIPYVPYNPPQITEPYYHYYYDTVGTSTTDNTDITQINNENDDNLYTYGFFDTQFL